MPQPTSYLLIVFLLVLAVAGVVIATYLLPPSERDNSGFSKYRLIYLCDGDDLGTIQSICTIRGDGSEKRMLITNEKLARPFYSPVLNNKEQIAYVCTSFERRSNLYQPDTAICSIGADGNGQQRLAFGSQGPHFFLAQNDVGQIIFECPNGICSTTMDPSGSLSANVEIIPLDPKLSRSKFGRRALNDQGIGVYPCYDYASSSLNSDQLLKKMEDTFYFGLLFNPHTDLCEFDLNAKKVWLLQEAPEGDMFTFPVINNEGLIVFGCGNLRDGFDVCSIQADGSGMQKLSNSEVPKFIAEIDMNDRGQIAFTCSDEVIAELSICTMNADGSDFHRITPADPFPNYYIPSINEDGVVAYLCGGSICIVNFDGKDPQVLTTFKSRQSRSHFLGQVQIR